MHLKMIESIIETMKKEVMNSSPEKEMFVATVKTKELMELPVNARGREAHEHQASRYASEIDHHFRLVGEQLVHEYDTKEVNALHLDWPINGVVAKEAIIDEIEQRLFGTLCIRPNGPTELIAQDLLALEQINGDSLDTHTHLFLVIFVTWSPDNLYEADGVGYNLGWFIRNGLAGTQKDTKNGEGK